MNLQGKFLIIHDTCTLILKILFLRNRDTVSFCTKTSEHLLPVNHYVLFVGRACMLANEIQ